jgi:hypothetical protein
MFGEDSINRCTDLGSLVWVYTEMPSYPLSTVPMKVLKFQNPLIPKCFCVPLSALISHQRQWIVTVTMRL